MDFLGDRHLDDDDDGDVFTEFEPILHLLDITGVTVLSESSGKKERAGLLLTCQHYTATIASYAGY